MKRLLWFSLLFVLTACQSGAYEEVNLLDFEVVVAGEVVPQQIEQMQLYALGSQCVSLEKAATCTDVGWEPEALNVIDVPQGETIEIHELTYGEHAKRITVDRVIDVESLETERVLEDGGEAFQVPTQSGHYMYIVTLHYSEGKQFKEADGSILLNLRVK